MYGTKKAPMRRHDKKRKYSPVGLLDTAGSRGRLASGLGGQLLAGRLASGGFTSGLSAEKSKHGSGAKHTAEKLQQESGQYLGAFRSNTDRQLFHLACSSTPQHKCTRRASCGQNDKRKGWVVYYNTQIQAADQVSGTVPPAPE